MATDKNFVIKNGLTIGTTEVLDSSGNLVNSSGSISGTTVTGSDRGTFEDLVLTGDADDDLTFKVFFPGKPPVKASQLSGGQKVVLAIAFRAALDRVFGRDVGMMFLDEPSSGLDADNVEYLHNALQQLATKVHGERQLVVITHVQELGGVFDQLIEINKG